MPTIAELQIKVDSTQAEQSIKTLNGLAEASVKVTKALKDQKAAQDSLNNGGGGGGNGGGGGGSKNLNDISSAIDSQVKKLKALEQQRKSLEASGLKATNVNEYNRLNQTIDANIERVKRQGNALDQLSRQEERAANQREQEAERKRKKDEAETKALSLREQLVLQVAAREKEALDRTLASLSAKTKAEQDYNRVVEQLSRARATQGMSGGGGFSDADYQLAIKRAQQIRDANISAADSRAGVRSADEVTAAIDKQIKKLKELEVERERLDKTGIKTSNPAEYKRLNQEIDARIELIRRQGSSVDQLARQEEKAERQRAASEAARRRQEEATVAALSARQNAEDRASAKADADLNRTLARLSTQAKAQLDYNKEIQSLNFQRQENVFGRSRGVTDTEYNDLVKLAAARRDAALAADTSTAANDKLQTKVDSITATFGRAQKAEVQYARDLKILADALSAGVVTVAQYNNALSQLTERRDKAIANASGLAAAEARFTEQLRATVTAYDPVLRASDSYGASVKILVQGLQSGKLTVTEFNKALTEQREALERAKAAAPGSSENTSARYQQQLDRLLPLNAQLRALADAEKILQSQQAAGKVTTDQQIQNHQRATEAIAAERKEIERRMEAGTRNTNSAKQDAAALRGLPAQFSDIVVSLQGGQAPLTVILQQGAQIKDMFGGVLPAIKAVGGALSAMITPLTVVGGAIAVLAVASLASTKEQTEFNKALVLSAGYSGISAAQFGVLRERIDGVVGTAGLAAEVLTAMASSGRIAGENFEAIAVAAIKFERATGESVEKVVEDFASLGKDPVNAAISLDEKYKFLTGSVLATANALVRQGREQEAVILLQGQMATAVDAAADKITERASFAAKAWKGVKDVVKEAWDETIALTRDQTVDEQIANTEKILKASAERSKGFFGFMFSDPNDSDDRSSAFLRDRLKVLKNYKKSTDEQAAAEKALEEARRKQNDIVKKNESDYISNIGIVDRVAAAQLALNTVKERGIQLDKTATVTGVALSKEVIDGQQAAVAAAEKRLEDAEKSRDKTKSSPLDTTNVSEVKNNIKELTAEYDGYYKKVTALGEANIVSAEATYQSQKAILEAQKDAVSKAYAAQVQAIKDLQGNKKNSASQNISLENQLSKAESDRVVALEKLDTKQEELQAKEKGRLDKRTASISAYKAALDAQLESLRESGSRAVENAGRGDAASVVATQLADNDRSFDKQQRQLAADQPTMDAVEYASKLKDLQDSHTAMTEQILQNNKDLEASNADWTNGFTKAVENAAADGRNFAKATETAVSGAFDSMGDALATFVTTGKLDFKSLTLSIISDLAKIAARTAASQVLSSLFGVASSAFGGVSTGISAATTSGFSEYGQITTQAKGGGWDGGKQFFAQGGAFTNSIVSAATSFPMSGGKTGVMGEAGPEAIVPLARTADGSLGVRQIGGSDSKGGVVVYVTITGDGATTETSDAGYQGFGKEIGDYIDNRYRTLQEADLRSGGVLNRAIKET